VRWRTQMFVHGFAASLVAQLGVLAVSAASDEGGVGFSERLARVVPVVPLAVFVGLALMVRRTRRRGELAALARAGFRPVFAIVAMLIGALLPAACVLCAAAWYARLDVFFPRPPTLLRFVWDGTGYAADGIRVAASGELSYSADAAAIHSWSPPAHGGAAALVAVVAALFAATLLSAGREWARQFGLLAAAHVVALLLFQAASAGYCPAWLAAIPTVFLAAYNRVFTQHRLSRLTAT
jgi:hypothetical protein